MKNIHTESFNSLTEFTAATKERPRTEIHNLKSSEEGSEKFTGTKTIEQAYNLVLKGYENGVKAIKPRGEMIAGGVTPVFNRFRGTLNIPAYACGNPEPFLTYKTETNLNLRRLRIVPMLTYSAGIKKETALIFAKALTVITNILGANYDTNITALFGNSEPDENNSKLKSIVEIQLKNYGETLLLNSVAAAYHPSTFRRIVFKYWENQDWKLPYGYGRVMGNTFARTLLKKLNKYAGETVLLMPALDDVEVNDIKRMIKLIIQRSVILTPFDEIKPEQEREQFKKLIEKDLQNVL